MTVLLFVLLIVAVAGLGLTGFQAFQWHREIARLNVELAGHQGKYEAERRQWEERAASAATKCNALVKRFNDEAKKWNANSASMKAELQRLSRWKNMADAEVAAAKMLKSAETTLTKAKADAESTIRAGQERLAAWQAEVEKQVASAFDHANSVLVAAQRDATALLDQSRQEADTIRASAVGDVEIAKKEAAKIVGEAKSRAKVLTEDAQHVQSSATARVFRMIADAERKAKEISESGYEAMRNAAQYEQAARALKNRVEGYGDEYIVPEANLLDELAESFAHEDAGRELRQARELSRIMVRNGSAATCDYSEANRRETAINFVIDAFDGKVDTILSRLKQENVGKLEQQIRDAFAVVNLNGKAFRDARICEEYLEARLNELKWGVIAKQMASREREEQRAIKERIREEAREAKERERALREAAKEEEIAQRAMEQLQRQHDLATGEQRELFESQLKDLEEKLKAAQEKKRTVSMAEQTKRGHVYIISNYGSFGDRVFKIGLTRRLTPLDRIQELGGASVPFGFDVHAMILNDDAPKLERQLHRHFILNQVNKVNHRKEFFRASIEEIREAIEKLGITTGISWTMTADAHEYRESVAIEKAFEKDPAAREAWANRQLRLETMDEERNGDAVEESDEE